MRSTQCRPCDVTRLGNGKSLVKGNFLEVSSIQLPNLFLLFTKRPLQIFFNNNQNHLLTFFFLFFFNNENHLLALFEIFFFLIIKRYTYIYKVIYIRQATRDTLKRYTKISWYRNISFQWTNRNGIQNGIHNISFTETTKFYIILAIS